MTLSSGIEAKVSGRQASSAPSDAAGKVLGVQPRDEGGKARFSNIVHWSYGTTWGGARGLITAAGIGKAETTVAHFAAVWGSSLVMLPVLGVAPPFWKQNASATAIDAFHHVVYAVGVGAVCASLDR